MTTQLPPPAPDPTTLLRSILAGHGVSEAALDEVMPVLGEHLGLRAESLHGVLSESGMLMPTYMFHNPVRNDPEFPGWDQMQAREEAARAAAREYVSVHLTTGWRERT